MNLIMKSFLEGYATSELNMGTMFFCMGIAAAIGLYIFMIYKLVNKNSFYNRNFNISLIALTVITAAIILTIQSNIVVSLGMVGALSIVRFRTAIKDPMDLVFLFWSISVGIICGAGFAMIAVIASVVLTIIIVCLSLFSSPRETMILVVNADEYNESQVLEAVKANCGFWKVRARNVSPEDVNRAAIEYVLTCMGLHDEDQYNGEERRYGETVLGYEDSHVVEALEVLLDYGLDPNKRYVELSDDGSIRDCWNIMYELWTTGNGYQAADALYLLLSNSGDSSLKLGSVSKINRND